MRKPLLPALAIATTLLMIQGCLTSRVYSRWEHSGEVPTLTLRLQSAGPSSVQLEWEPKTTELPLSGGTLEFNPKLEHCSAVSVIATDGGDTQALEPGVPRALSANTSYTDSGIRSLWMGLDEVECKVLFVVASTYHPEIRPVVYASTAMGELSMATIPTLRNPHWLQLMPVTLLADATLIVSAACLVKPERNPCLLLLLSWADSEY